VNHRDGVRALGLSIADPAAPALPWMNVECIEEDGTLSNHRAATQPEVIIPAVRVKDNDR